MFFIAEAGVNHNGDETRALEMVSVARDAGADAIKFQSFKTEKVLSRAAPKAAYQARETGSGNQYDMVKPLEMSDALHERLARKCEETGVEFMSTPFDEESLQLLIDLGVRRLKIPSGEITNTPFLREFAGHDIPLILSTGMADLAEIDEALATIAQSRAGHGFAAPMNERLTVLHCTSNYPAAFADVNLRAMSTIAAHTGLPVGYSDHTLGPTVGISAVALGAQVIEKHFTLDRTLPGPDHRASMEPGELTAMIAAIRDVETALGSPIKAPAPAELDTRAVARRSVAAAHALPAGHLLVPGDLCTMRPGTGIAPKFIDDVAGRTLKIAVVFGHPLSWDELG